MDGFFKHIFLENKARSINFTPLGSGRFETNKNIDQTKHGNKLKNEFEEAFLDFWQGEPGDFVYVELETFPGFELDIKKFEAIDKEQGYIYNYMKGNLISKSRIK